MSTEDWLTDEKFDFDVTASPVLCDNYVSDGVSDLIDGDEDDEEVFFGPTSFKEKCVASVVTEKEAVHQTLDSLNPEQQALLLRESAVLNLMIKHGTPNSSKPSPIAVVHPMKRVQDTEELKEILKKNVTENNETNKENIQIIENTKTHLPKTANTLKMSKILQPKFTAKTRPASQPEVTNSTKLPVAKQRIKLNSELSEPLVDKASLYGLPEDRILSSSRRTNVRRRSGLPTKQAAESLKTKPNISKSAILQSTSSLTRMKVPSTSIVSESKLKPLKATGIPSGLPQSQMRLPNPRKSTLTSQGTPSKSGKIPSSSSLRRRPSFDRKQIATPSTKNDTVPIASKLRGPGNLVTPVQRTPSTRKSITGRQLLVKNAEVKPRTISPTEVKDSSTNKVSLSETPYNKPANVTQSTTNTAVTDVNKELPSHIDIINRYKKLCASRNATQPESSMNNVVNTSDLPVLERDDLNQLNGLELAAKSIDIVQADSENSVGQITNKFSELAVPANESIVSVAPLLELACDSPLLHLSPQKSAENFLDPFHTGNTPTPLIEIGDVLQPEKPKESNLIEF